MPSRLKREALKAAERPTYEELLEVLDNVSATAENVIAHYHPDTAEKYQRSALVDRARKLCDRLLRGPQ